MVCADSDQTSPLLDSMAMGLERSNPLHNFNLPFLKWGNQRFLRCMKLDSDADADADLPPPSLRRSSSAVRWNSRKFQSERPAPFRDSAKRIRASKSKIHDNYEADEGIAAVREKLMIDLKTAADRMKVAFWRDGVDDDEDETTKPEKKIPTVPAPAPATEVRPWSLRVRKAASSKAPMDKTTDEDALKVKKRPEKRPMRSGDSGGGDGDGDGGVKSSGRRRLVTVEKKEREKFSVALSKKEIEEDFLAMIDRRPPRRPKKRPRIIQNQIDTIFPGLWLTEITADLYDVPEISKNAKR